MDKPNVWKTIRKFNEHNNKKESPWRFWLWTNSKLMGTSGGIRIDEDACQGKCTLKSMYRNNLHWEEEWSTMKMPFTFDMIAFNQTVWEPYRAMIME